MVAEGKLIYKSGWYEPIDEETYLLIGKYIKGIRVNKNGKMQIKICKRSKKSLNAWLMAFNYKWEL